MMQRSATRPLFPFGGDLCGCCVRQSMAIAYFRTSGGRDLSICPPNCLRMAESIFSRESVRPGASGTGRRARRQNFGGDRLFDGGHEWSSGLRPSPGQSRCIDSSSGPSASAMALRSSSQELTTLPRRQSSAISRGRDCSGALAGVPWKLALSMMSKPSPYACMRPYSMPLCTIFTKWPEPTGPQCR